VAESVRSGLPQLTTCDIIPMSDSLKDQIKAGYMHYMLEHGHAPESVYKFCKHHEMEESDFYKAFPGFPAVESAIWADGMHNSSRILHEDEEFASYPTQQKILACLYTYIEQALAHRSFMLISFPGPNPSKPTLKKLTHNYNHMVNEWVEQAVEHGEIARRGRLTEVYSNVFSLHLLLVIDFWLKDESEQFQRTDAYIEKTVKFVFELIRTQAVDAAVDLARFFSGMREL